MVKLFTTLRLMKATAIKAAMVTVWVAIRWAARAVGWAVAVVVARNATRWAVARAALVDPVIHVAVKPGVPA